MAIAYYGEYYGYGGQGYDYGQAYPPGSSPIMVPYPEHEPQEVVQEEHLQKQVLQALRQFREQINNMFNATIIAISSAPTKQDALRDVEMFREKALQVLNNYTDLFNKYNPLLTQRLKVWIEQLVNLLKELAEKHNISSFYENYNIVSIEFQTFMQGFTIPSYETLKQYFTPPQQQQQQTKPSEKGGQTTGGTKTKPTTTSTTQKPTGTSKGQTKGGTSGTTSGGSTKGGSESGGSEEGGGTIKYVKKFIIFAIPTDWNNEAVIVQGWIWENDKWQVVRKAIVYISFDNVEKKLYLSTENTLMESFPLPYIKQQIYSTAVEVVKEALEKKYPGGEVYAELTSNGMIHVEVYAKKNVDMKIPTDWNNESVVVKGWILENVKTKKWKKAKLTFTFEGVKKEEYWKTKDSDISMLYQLIFSTAEEVIKEALEKKFPGAKIIVETTGSGKLHVEIVKTYEFYALKLKQLYEKALKGNLGGWKNRLDIGDITLFGRYGWQIVQEAPEEYRPKLKKLYNKYLTMLFKKLLSQQSQT